MPLYLYGIVPAGREPPPASTSVQPAQSELRVESHGGVAGLVCDVASTRIVMNSANLSAHHAVVEAAAAHGTIVPARFGTVVPSVEALVDYVLAPRRHSIARAFATLDGRAALRVTAKYEEDAILREAVREDPHIARLQRRVANRSAAASYYDRIELGEAVVGRLARIQARDDDALFRRLRGMADAMKVLNRAEGGFTRIACLVPRSQLPHFEELIEEVAHEQAGRMTFEMAGPLAPWDFSELPAEDTESARRRAVPAMSGRRGWG